MWQSGLRYLLGTWNDESRTGEPGAATAGGESWKSELDARVLVRRGWCEFPSTGKRPAYRHEDLLILFAEAGSMVHGIFWDNEGHTISYREVRVDPSGKGMRLLSDPALPGPRQQLEYRFEPPDRVSAVFSILLPGAAGFSPYLRWRSVRTRRLSGRSETAPEPRKPVEEFDTTTDSADGPW